MRNGSKASELKGGRGGRGGRAHGGDLGNEHIKIVTVPTSQSIVTCFFLYLTRGFCMTCGLSCVNTCHPRGWPMPCPYYLCGLRIEIFIT